MSNPLAMVAAGGEAQAVAANNDYTLSKTSWLESEAQELINYAPELDVSYQC
jgi:hypothetical protein